MVTESVPAPALSERRQQDVQDVPAVRRVARHRRPQVRRAFLSAREEIMHALLRGEPFEQGERRPTPRADEPVPHSRILEVQRIMAPALDRGEVLAPGEQ